MRFPTKIPTILGFFLVIALVGVTGFVVEKYFREPSRASESQQPIGVKITNISNNAITVSWTTSGVATGTILVSGPGKNNRMYYDERDLGGNLGTYTSHLITVKDLEAQKQYTLKIFSNGKPYGNGDKPYQTQTAPSISANTNIAEPAYGTILKPDGSPAADALVYLTLEGGQEMAALTKNSGQWILPLNQVRTDDLSQFLPMTERMVETIVVRHNAGQITSVADTMNDSPVPDMTIGEQYDFRGFQANVKSKKSIALAVETQKNIQATPIQLPVGGDVLGEKTSGVYAVTLDTPKNNTKINTAFPLISGTGIPNAIVGISLGIVKPTSGSTKVKSDGTWTFSPKTPLAAGRQSVTITTTDAKGKAVAQTHLFEVLKSGTQVLGDATPSATLNPTVTISPTTTPVATETASPTPTEIATDVSTLSGNALPTSGYELPTILLLIIGLGLLTSGVAALRF